MQLQRFALPLRAADFGRLPQVLPSKKIYPPVFVVVNIERAAFVRKAAAVIDSYRIFTLFAIAAALALQGFAGLPCYKKAVLLYKKAVLPYKKAGFPYPAKMYRYHFTGNVILIRSPSISKAVI